MATVNLGLIKFRWQGAYAGGTAYVKDDVVSYNGSSYVCILASTGNLPTNTTYWNVMAQGGTDITSLAGLAQGDILYYNGSDWVRLGAGTAGQYLETQGSGANPQWSTVSTGAYSIAEIQRAEISSETHAGNTHTAYPFGTTLSLTPTASTDLFQIIMNTNIEGQQGSYYGIGIGVNTSDSWGSSTNDSRLKLNEGEHTRGMGSGNDSERYQHWNFNGIYTMSELSMSANTQYYFKLHVHGHNPAGQIKTGFTANNQNDRVNNFSIIRYKV